MRAYPATNHNLIKALERADVLFPISREELLTRMQGRSVRVGWDKTVPFNEYMSGVKIDYVQVCRINGQLASTMGNVPMWCIYLCLPISCTLYGLFSLGRLVRDIRCPEETQNEGQPQKEGEKEGEIQ